MPIINQTPLIIPDEATVIWRYMSLPKFESLLESKALFFCRSDKFSDPFEGSTPRKEVENRFEEQKAVAIFQNRTFSIEEAIKGSKDIASLHKTHRPSFIVNCWHINFGESDAMWQLYLKSNEGIAIQTSVKKLRQSFSLTTEDILISKVRYIDYENDIWFHESEYPERGYNIFSPIIHKRSAFEHERELRIFQKVQKAVGNGDFWQGKKGKLVECNINSLVNKIILPPTSDDMVRLKVLDIIKRFNFEFIVEKSTLNKEPYF